MGNVPISCCRSKSPRLQSSYSSSKSSSSNYRNGIDGQYSTNNESQDSVYGGKYGHKSRKGEDFDAASQPSHILQHISEREPDDSATDPSSNPSNRPIFASRSSNAKNKTNNHHNDSYSSANSTSRKHYNTPIISSQDYGYNSATSTNLTQHDGPLNDSFESSLGHQQQVTQFQNELMLFSTNDQKNIRQLFSNSLSSCEDVDITSNCCDNNRLDNLNKDSRFYSNNLVKSSSCSTIFIDGSTISQPNLKQTIKWVSLAIYYHIKNRTTDYAAEIFDESIHPLRMPRLNSDNPQVELITSTREETLIDRLEEPNLKTIHNFVKTLFEAAQLTSEYAITTLVYLERLMTYAEMDLTPKTWRRMFLGAILLSSKVWEDQAVWNVDYAQILEEISVEDINELERQFLELVQFNTNVQSSVYAKYYFHLRTLALNNGLSAQYNLLTVGEAKALEALSGIHTADWQSSPIHRRISSTVKRHTSLERLRLSGQSMAILM